MCKIAHHLKWRVKNINIVWSREKPSNDHSENVKNGYKLKSLQNNILPLHKGVRYLLKDSTIVLFSEAATTGILPDRSSTQIVMAEVSILNWSLKIESNLNMRSS